MQRTLSRNVTRGLGAGIAVLVGSLFAGGAAAQVASGPAVGAGIEPLKVVVAAGDNAGQEIDMAQDRKGKPTLYVFVQADRWDRPVARFLKTLDQALATDHPDVKIVAVWLTDDVAKSKDYLPKAQQSLKLMQTTLTVHPGDKEGPAGWGMNSNAHLTVVVARDQKVASTLAYGSVNETDVPAVLKDVKPKEPK